MKKIKFKKKKKKQNMRIKIKKLLIVGMLKIFFLTFTLKKKIKMRLHRNHVFLIFLKKWKNKDYHWKNQVEIVHM